MPPAPPFIGLLCRYIKNTCVKHIFAPQYENLSIEKVLEFAQEHAEVWDYLPARKDCYRLSRQFLLNVMHTIVGEPFVDWVQERVDCRNAKVAESRNMLIELDPEVATAFQASTQVSSKFIVARTTAAA